MTEQFPEIAVSWNSNVLEQQCPGILNFPKPNAQAVNLYSESTRGARRPSRAMNPDADSIVQVVRCPSPKRFISWNISMTKTVNVAMVGLGFGAEFIPIYNAHPNTQRVGDLPAQ